ncbi:helix-turn-helix transcriptional regulator [[Kitasatospora] papulosa]|uniref:helix-turn-helix transcriptional regulator n=1 Tax=[Kitasatospora] papulosa TaxID=1464011 RepID=UPI0036429326
MPSRRTPLPDWVHAARRELGHKIAVRRRELGLSQDGLADRIGMERRSVQRYEAGARDPGYGELLLIARALEVTVADLVQE